MECLDHHISDTLAQHNDPEDGGFSLVGEAAGAMASEPEGCGRAQEDKETEITGQGGSSPTGTPDTSSTGTVNNVSFTSGYSEPEIDHDTGDVLYIENRTPIQRAPDQTENIKLVIEF